MKKPKLEVQKRKIFGRKVKKLRAKGILPANIYGKKVKSTAVEVDLKNFREVYKEAGETSVIDLLVKGESKPRSVLIYNLQSDPVTDFPLHVDFHQIDLKEKTTVEVPIELVGESPAEKEKIGVLVTLLDKVEVEALPDDFPEKFEVDISELKEVDNAIRVKDIKIDRKKIKILAAENEIVVKIEPLAKEEVVEEKEAEEAKAEEAKPEGKEVEKEAESTEAKPKEEKKNEEEKPA